MTVVTRIAEARVAVREARRAGHRVALVPTMGSLHQGHLTLATEATRHAGYVVMSVFVNPLQFGPKEDFRSYPRDAVGDSTRAHGAGVDLVFIPETAEMYEPNPPVVVTPRAVADLWEGAVRPGHFEGVLTIVAKLFNIVQPDVAVFGQKDIQQVTLVEAMIRGLDFPIDLLVVPTVREPDGLAMSSRNSYLSADDRVHALALSRALRSVEEAWRRGERRTAVLEQAGRAVLRDAPAITVDYFALVAPSTLAPAATAHENTIAMVAARVGPTRLIDNIILGGENGAIVRTPFSSTTGAVGAR